MTGGVLFKPVNITNLILQNSFIVIMALGMLLIIVAGHIDLSVGSIVAFTGGLSAIMLVKWGIHYSIVVPLCLILGGLVGAAQGYWIAYQKIPSFIVTLAGMLVFRGIDLSHPAEPPDRPVPEGFPVAVDRLHSRFSVLGPQSGTRRRSRISSRSWLGDVHVALVAACRYLLRPARSRASTRSTAPRTNPSAFFCAGQMVDHRAGRDLPRLPALDLSRACPTC